MYSPYTTDNELEEAGEHHVVCGGQPLAAEQLERRHPPAPAADNNKTQLVDYSIELSNIYYILIGKLQFCSLKTYVNN